MLPAQDLLRLAGIAQQQVDLGRAEIPGIDLDQQLAGLGVHAFFFDILAAPGDLASGFGEGEFDEFAHRMGLAGGEHVIIRLVLLQNQPHALYIIAGITPIALGVEIADIEGLLQPVMDRRHRPGDLAGDEGFAAGGAFKIEENAVGRCMP